MYSYTSLFYIHILTSIFTLIFNFINKYKFTYLNYHLPLRIQDMFFFIASMSPDKREVVLSKGEKLNGKQKDSKKDSKWMVKGC